MPRRRHDVFISHAWEDKDAIARPLAEELRRRGFDVWYDEFSLKMGDSLRGSIDYGLANSRFGLVILSKNFFAKHWPVQPRSPPNPNPVPHNFYSDKIANPPCPGGRWKGSIARP